MCKAIPRLESGTHSQHTETASSESRGMESAFPFRQRSRVNAGNTTVARWTMFANRVFTSEQEVANGGLGILEILDGQPLKLLGSHLTGQNGAQSPEVRQESGRQLLTTKLSAILFGVAVHPVWSKNSSNPS